MSKASDSAYATIREMIVSGALAPGDPVREEALAEICGVSRTPIREAMRRLESDMLIQRSESQRSFVSEWSLDDIEDAYELRALLEGVAAHRACKVITGEQVAELKAINARLGQAIARQPADIEGFLAANRDFHALILSVVGSARLEALLQSLIEAPIVWRTAHHYSEDELGRSHHEHEELIAAFDRGDENWATTIMEGHIRRAFHVYADAHRSLTGFDDELVKRSA